MSLTELLAAKGIASATVVDDVFDAVLTSADIGPTNEAWPNFNDDLTAEHRDQIRAAYPRSAEIPFDELIEDDAYVAALWALRDELGAVAEPLFHEYVSDQAADQRFVDLAVGKLTELGLACQTSGRNFGVSLVLLGVVMLVIGIGYHAWFMLALRRQRSTMAEDRLVYGESPFPPSMTLITAILLLVLGLVAMASMTLHMGPFE